MAFQGYYQARTSLARLLTGEYAPRPRATLPSTLNLDARELRSGAKHYKDADAEFSYVLDDMDEDEDVDMDDERVDDGEGESMEDGDGADMAEDVHEVETNDEVDDDGAYLAQHWKPSGRSSPVIVVKEEEDEMLGNAMTPAGRIVASINALITQLTPIAARKAYTWRQSLRNTARDVSGSTRTIIGIIGATGAGKSALINALLADHIVPTDGMKSCTSTPIEISYHEEELVNASIEFISKESWLQEIRHLISALKEVDGVASKLVEDGKEAYDRIHVVYPNLAPDSILRSSAEQILQSDPFIACKLDSTVVFSSSRSYFKTELATFTSTHRQSVDLWPLVGRVCLQCNASVLKNNVTMVDLPGLLDSNTARAALYEDYLKRCDHIFIVAPIKRAATDKVAKDLIGDAFRAQLMNDKYSPERVTFVATCNDDLLCSEIVSALRLHEDEGWKQLEILKRTSGERRARLKQDIAALQARKSSDTALAQSLHRRLEQKRREYERLSLNNVEKARNMYCARKRSEWAHEEIQSQFRQGLDALEDGEVGRIDEGVISVFSVSARDFMKVIGKSPQDGSVAVFQSPNETEIPALVEYISGIGSASKRKFNQTNAAKLSVIVQELTAWCTTSQVGSRRDRDQLRRDWETLAPSEDGTYTDYTQKIASTIQNAVEESSAQFRHDLEHVLIPQMEAAAEQAEEEVSRRLVKLGQRIRYWPTLKAVFRRCGVWKEHDWNGVAVEMLSHHFAATWKHTLNGRHLQKNARLVTTAVDAALGHVEDASADSLRLLVITHKVKALDHVNKALTTVIAARQATIRDKQQQISREMTADVARQLRALYTRCWAERGRGAKNNALELFREGVEDIKFDLFSSVVARTADLLRHMLSVQLDAHAAEAAGMAQLVASRMSPIWDDNVPNIAFLQQQASAKALLAKIAASIEELKFEG